jgi:hypothetical protein
MTTPAQTSPAAEVRRLRTELSELHHLVAALIDALDPVGEVEYRRQLCAVVAAVAYEAGIKAGYERCAAHYEASWRAAAAPVAGRGGRVA